MISTREIIKKYCLLEDRLKTRKHGQNFLLEDDIPKKIVKYFSIKSDDGSDILEIGPGAGSLTKQLLSLDVKKVLAVEIDKNCYEAIRNEFNDLKLILLNKDALKTSLNWLVENNYINTGFHIISNLPYNVGIALLMKWLIEDISHIKSMTLMYQKEVVDRIIAKPNCKIYGRLSVICQYLCDIIKFFDVGPEYFTPQPKIISSVVHLIPKKDIDLSIINNLSNITNIAFSKRRKMISNSLKCLFDEETWESLKKRLNFSDQDRPEDLSYEIFSEMAKNI